MIKIALQFSQTCCKCRQQYAKTCVLSKKGLGSTAAYAEYIV
jgi:hypothetical protein